jgi:type II secretion system protein G
MIATHKTTKPRRRRAFSLLELMLVLAIMGILMAVVAINMVGHGARAQVTAAKASLKTIKTNVDTYYITYSSYPPDLQTLVTCKMIERGSLSDPWKLPFLYDSHGVSTDEPYVLGSAGPDKVVGTPDDLSVWTMDNDPPQGH